jgi:hypothetical protein
MRRSWYRRNMAMLLLLLALDLTAAANPLEPLVGEQSWVHEERCVRRMRDAVARLDLELPRLAGRWSVERSAELVELKMELGGIVAMVYLDLATNRKVRPHPRRPTGPWKPEKDQSPFTLSKRRNADEQGAWIAYSEILSPSEGRTFEAIVEPALDACVATFDRTYKIARWAPNNGRIWFELQPRF